MVESLLSGGAEVAGGGGEGAGGEGATTLLRSAKGRIDVQHCGGQKAAAVARDGARALMLAVGGSLCAYGEGGRGAAGLGRTRTTR